MIFGVLHTVIERATTLSILYSLTISDYYYFFTAQDCLNYMQNGSELIKVRSNSRQYHRTFLLNPDMTEIRWYPTSKKAHKARSKYIFTSSN